MKLFSRQCLRLGLLTLLVAWAPFGHAQETPIKVVATFSILGDMVKAVGGDRIEVTNLVGPNGDTHVYSPTPADAKNILKADLLFINGLGFEGWLNRLVKASGYEGKVITVTEGIKGLPFEHNDQHGEKHDDEHEEDRGKEHDDEHGKEHSDEHDDDHAKDHGDEHEHGDIDPHAWHSLAHVKTYIQNITRALQQADPSGKTIYATNQDAYLKELVALEQLIAETLQTLPKKRRTVVTSHDAFGYFGDSYQLKFLAPQGLSTESEATARDVAALIEQIRADNISALFIENMVSPRLLKQIAAESGLSVGGLLYAGALSEPDGEAGTYLKMMKHNIMTIYQALKPE